ncbi:MAG: peroxiredoxin [Candidatus Sericytochromatia bacterium]
MHKSKVLGFLSLCLILGFQIETNAKDTKNTDIYKYAEKSKPKVGNKAPDFVVQDSNGKNIKLSDFVGKKNVLLVFYPGDNTPGCTKQLCSIRDDFKGLEKLNVKVFGVNQADSESHKSFINKHNFQFELLVDKDKKIATEYDAVGFFGIISRTVVLINKEGKIVLYERGFPDVSPKAIDKLI